MEFEATKRAPKVECSFIKFKLIMNMLAIKLNELKRLIDQEASIVMISTRNPSLRRICYEEIDSCVNITKKLLSKLNL